MYEEALWLAARLHRLLPDEPEVTGLLALILLARQRDAGVAAPPDPADALHAGAKAGLRPLHDALLGQIRALGAFDIAPKKGYLSLRRRKQFAMVQHSTASRIDLGLILRATTPATGRLESAARFNPLFSRRVRITAATDLDDELRQAARWQQFRLAAQSPGGQQGAAVPEHRCARWLRTATET